MSKHTRWPWAASETSDNGVVCLEVRGQQDLRLVAEVWGNDREANAALICATPDLLDALEGLMGVLERSGELNRSRMGHQLLDAPAAKARAAIAKARGGTP